MGKIVRGNILKYWVNHKTSFFYILSIIIVFQNITHAKSIDFEKNKWLVEMNMNGIKRYRYLMNQIDTKKTNIILDIDSVYIIDEKSKYLFKTFAGNYEKSINYYGGDFALILRNPELVKDYNMSIYVIASFVDFLNLEVIDPDTGEKNISNWNNAFLIIGGRVFFDNNLKMSIAFASKAYPRFMKNILNEDVLYYSGDIYNLKSNTINSYLVFNFEYDNWDPMLFFNESGINLLQLRKTFMGENDIIKFGFESGYNSDVNTAQLEFFCNNFKLAKFFTINNEFSINYFFKNELLQFSYFASSQIFDILTDEEYNGLTIITAESISFDIFEEFILGVNLQVVYNNEMVSNYKVTCAIYASYNYYRDLYIYPNKNDFMVGAKIGVEIG